MGCHSFNYLLARWEALSALLDFGVYTENIMELYFCISI